MLFVVGTSFGCWRKAARVIPVAISTATVSWGQVPIRDAPQLSFVSSAAPGSQQTVPQSETIDGTVAHTQTNATPAETGLWSRKYLFGVDAQRTHLADEGVLIDFYYISDALANPIGGTHPDGQTWFGRVRGTLDIDFGKRTALKGMSFHIAGGWQNGANIGGVDYIDSLASPSSFASIHAFRAVECVLSQYLFGKHLQLRGGKIATMNSYGVQEYGSSYINEPMGYAFSTFLNTWMAYDPSGAPAFEVRVLPTPHWYVKAMAQSEETTPYTEDPTGFGFHFKGPVAVAEVGYMHEPPQAPDSTATLGPEDVPYSATGRYPAVYKFGGSYVPTTFTNQLTGKISGGNYLIWAQANQAVYREREQGPNEHRGLDVTGTVDHSPNDVNQQNQQIDAGLRYVGPFRGAHFANDTLNVGWVRTSNGRQYQQTLLLSGKGPHRAENLVEVNYLANLTAWLLFQPTAEWIVSPGADSHAGTVFVTGFRLKVTF